MRGVAVAPGTLQGRLRGARVLAIVGIGDEFNPADRYGMVAARRIGRQRFPGVRVFLAGSVPESITGPVRMFRPDHVVFLDAAEMGERPGTIAAIAPGQVAGSLFSTHALPLPVVMDYIRLETGAGVTLVGVQPDNQSPGKGLSGEDLEYLEENLRLLLAVIRDRLRPKGRPGSGRGSGR